MSNENSNHSNIRYFKMPKNLEFNQFLFTTILPINKTHKSIKQNSQKHKPHNSNPKTYLVWSLKEIETSSEFSRFTEIQSTVLAVPGCELASGPENPRILETTRTFGPTRSSCFESIKEKAKECKKERKQKNLKGGREMF